MRSQVFFCPSLSNIFRPSASPSDPAVVDVARAIYYGGRADGLPGLEAVAHVIQNRCSHPSFPFEPQSVVLAGTEQFARGHQTSAAPVLQTSVEKQLFEKARRLAIQLVYSSQCLAFPDPTGGALYFDRRFPATVHSVSRRLGLPPSSQSTSPHPPVTPGAHPPMSIAPAAPVGDTAPISWPPTPPTTPPVPSLPPSSGLMPGIAPRTRPMLPGRGNSGLQVSRALMSRHRGPVDDDGSHDMILPCGLFQEEVIDIMYRDLKPEDFEMLSKLDERLPKRNIVQRTLVERLPRRPARDCECSECGVCLQELDPNMRVVQLPCRHAFHPACISRWLTQCKNTCPLCSVPIETAQAPAGNIEAPHGTSEEIPQHPPRSRRDAPVAWDRQGPRPAQVADDEAYL
mmetsp:Transcript_109545/g.244560  ORF Transcript_109545/g.244560 Transcript_109545/m.244560 type:complete len:400 (+) Transcript_109545:121-1320(+)